MFSYFVLFVVVFIPTITICFIYFYHNHSLLPPNLFWKVNPLKDRPKVNGICGMASAS